MTSASGGLAVSLLLSACGAAPAPTSTGAQPLPTNGVIAQAGHYRLVRDLRVSRDAGITIHADDVTLDLGGKVLRYDPPAQPGTFGIVVARCRNIRITNGVISGFWFNISSTDSQVLRIDQVRFEDIPYVAVHTAGSRNVLISDNSFSGFRYDVPKPGKDRYVIGVNIGAADAIIAHNRFESRYPGGDSGHGGIETVHVLFSADVSRGCVVTHNTMAADRVVAGSYGIWAAAGTQITATHNRIRNMKYGLCVGSNATALAGYNHFTVHARLSGSPPVECVGVYAAAAGNLVTIDNDFRGIMTSIVAPEGQGK